MSGRKSIRTTKKQIADYWAGRVDESELSVDFSEAGKRCWRCGCKRGLQRSHIIPDSLGGPDIPSNFVLLCSRCHLDNPNVSDPEIMWDWIRAYKVPFYDTFWSIQGLKEYEKIYAISFGEELKNRKISERGFAEIQEILERKIKEASYHFGDPHLNIATIAGIYRMTLKEYDTRHDLQTEHEVKPYVKLKDFM